MTSYDELAQVLDALPLLLREARRSRGFSLRAAAAQIGCSFSTITRFEGGEDVSLSNAGKILRWLDTTPHRRSVGRSHTYWRAATDDNSLHGIGATLTKPKEG